MTKDFFKCNEVETKFIAVEKINILYNLFTTLLIIIFYNTHICLHQVPFQVYGNGEDGISNVPAQLLVPRYF